MRDTSKSGGKKICSQSYQMQPCRVKSDGLLELSNIEPRIAYKTIFDFNGRSQAGVAKIPFVLLCKRNVCS
jgi:hypothetical protein